MTSKTRILFLVMISLAALALAGCGGTSCSSTQNLTSGGSGSGGAVNTGGNICGAGVSGNNGPSAAFAFYLGSGVETGALSTSGNFATVTQTTPPALSGSTIDSMTVVGNSLYLPFGDTMSVVQGFTIDHTTGLLTSIPGSPFALNPVGGTADTVVADPKQRFLFAGSEVSGFVNVFQINSTTGALTEISGSPFTNQFNFFSADIMAVDSTSTYLYAGQGSFSSGIVGFSIDQTSGALTELAGSPFLLNVAQIHASPTGNFLLGVQEIQDSQNGTDQHIYVFSIDTTSGVPTPVAGSPFATTSAPFDFAISPNGKFVYITGNDPVTKTASPIEAYSIDATTGALTALPGSPYASLPTATQCQFDQSGGLMFCATPAGISAFSANPSTGAITHIADLAASSFPFAVSD